MFKSICLALGFLVCIVGCQKPEESEPKPAWQVVGEFQMADSNGWMGNEPVSGSVTFYGEGPDRSSFLYADSVFADEIPVSNFLTGPLYWLRNMDTALFRLPVTWRVVGANGIPSFTYTLKGNFPHFTVPYLSSIKLDTAINIVLPPIAFANADTAWATLTKDSVQLIHGIDRINATAVFTPAELNRFQALEKADLQIIVVKYDTLKMPGAIFRFSRMHAWNERDITIK